MVIKPIHFRKFSAVLFVLAALIITMHPIIASAANITITKGVETITIPSYNADDTLIITGSALEADDWNILKALTTNFKLRMENTQTEIPENALDNCTTLTALDLSALPGLRTIKRGAFQVCISLTQANLSGCSQLVSIAEDAFYRCTTLTTLNLSGCTGLQSIGANVFRDCDNLAHVDLSPCTGLQSIGVGAFRSCNALAGVTLSGCSNLTSIADNAFYQCTALTTLDLNGCTGLLSIGANAFYDCNLLAHVNLSHCTSLQTIGAGAFQSCNALVDVTLSGCSNLTSIADRAFSQNTALRTVDLSGCTGLKSIGANAFRDCDFLTRVNLFNCTSLQTIGASAFQNCNALTEIRLNRTSPPTLGADIFWQSGNIKIYVPSSLVATYKNAWPDYEDKIFAMSSIAAPTATPSGGSYTGPQTVVLGCSTEGATIYYTVDGSNPRASSTRNTYTAALTIPLGTTLKAYATKDGLQDSDVLTQTYTQVGFVAEPTATPSGGSYTGPQTVVLECLTPGAAIYYTLDGSNPRASSTRNTYTAALTIPLGTTLKAYAAKDGLQDSEVLTQTYTQMQTNCNSSSGCNSGVAVVGLGLVISLLAVLTKKRQNRKA